MGAGAGSEAAEDKKGVFGGFFGLPIADLEQLDIAQESAPPWPEVERWSRIPLAEIPARSSPFLR